MGLTSCIKDNLYESEAEMFSIKATVEDDLPSTKLGFDLENAGSFFWNNEDAIAIGSSSLAKFTTTDADGSTSATFTGPSEPKGYTVYPYSRVASIKDNVLTYTFAGRRRLWEGSGVI